MNADPLITTLIDLDRAIARPSFRLIVGGGFGLYLRQIHLQQKAESRTLFSGDVWPFPRSTEDVDLLLPTEFLVSLAEMQGLRNALNRIGFVPVKEAKFLHFVKPWGAAGRLKIDMLTGPLDRTSIAKLKVNRPRVRPRGAVELHAYLTDEAIDFEKSLLALELDGIGSDNQARTVTVHIPQPFTFLLMKLHAFADRLRDEALDAGNVDRTRHHALDVYRIVAMLTEAEFDQVRQLAHKHTALSPLIRVRQIIRDHFSSLSAMGSIRLREHPLFAPRMDVARLIQSLSDLFGS